MDIIKEQPWATTGAVKPTVDYDRSFYGVECIGCIDAPMFIPSGSTIKGGEAIIGGLAFRQIDI